MAKLKLIGKCFPNLNRTVAYYDPATGYVNLNDISEKELDVIRRDPYTARNIENFKVVCHEIRHNADHIATLWGQKNLLLHMKALNIRLQNDINRFPEIVSYKIQDNQLFYAEYFTEEYNYVPVDKMDRRWKWESASGIRFNHKGVSDERYPIPLIRFSAYDGTPLVRIPISIAALLETNAVLEETKHQVAYFGTLNAADLPFHAKLYEKDTIGNLIYNQELAVYNVAVHLTANLLGISDIFEGYKISSTIATVTLNLPSSVVRGLPIDKEFFGPWGERPQSMLNNNEYGFIFFVLLANYREVYAEKKEFDIHDVLAASKLPKYGELKSLISREMASLKDEAEMYPLFKEVFIPKMIAGKKVFNTLGLGFENGQVIEALFNNGYTPTILCNDTDIDLKDYRYSQMNKILQTVKLDLSEWYNIASILNDKLTEIFEVRGI